MSGDEKSQEGVWGPPRRGVAGKTGTHQIVFKNGAVVTLPKTKLSFTQPGNFPKFAATMGQGGDQRVSSCGALACRQYGFRVSRQFLLR